VGHSILIVDDDAEIAKLLTIRLTKVGYTISVASDGTKALQAVEQAKPDLILLDVMMPGKSGWDVLRALKADAALRDIKVVMVSAIGEITNEITARMYGANGHVDKPFEFETLEAVIRDVLAA
jgi:DNA-binding response OmpR family regulator